MWASLFAAVTCHGEVEEMKGAFSVGTRPPLSFASMTPESGATLCFRPPYVTLHFEFS